MGLSRHHRIMRMTRKPQVGHPSHCDIRMHLDRTIVSSYRAVICEEFITVRLQRVSEKLGLLRNSLSALEMNPLS